MTGMQIKLDKKKVGDSFIYSTDILNTRMTLSKKLVQSLRERGLFGERVTIEDDWAITAQTVTKGDKVYTNFYLYKKEAKYEELKTDEEPPF